MSGRKATDRVIPGDYALSVNAAEMAHPDHWVQVPLMDIARLESGHTPSRRHPEWWGGDVPWISIPDAREHHGGTIQETKSYTNDDGLANSAARLLPEGTVCLSRTASVGYSTVMGRPMATSQDFVNWVCSEAVDPHWLKHLFIAEEHALKHRFGKGSTHTTIYYPEVKAFNVCLPPVNEQKRIVAKLDALQERSRRAHEALDAIPALLDRFRQSVLAAAFRGDLTADWRAQHPDVEPASVLLERIRAERKVRWIAADAEKARARAQKRAEKKGQAWGPEQDAKALEAGQKKAEKKYTEPEPVDPEAEGLPELPEGWCWASVEELAALRDRAIQSGPFGSALKHSEFTRDGILVVGIDNVQDGRFSIGRQNRIPPHKFEELRRFQARPGDVLITVMATVGRCAVLPDDLETAIITKHVYRISVEQRLFLPHLLMNALRGAPSVVEQIGDGVRGQTRAGINGGVLKKLRIPVPPPQEQRPILEAVTAVFGSADAVQGQVHEGAMRLGVLDQAILAKAFRGELVPQDPSDEPASALLERIRAEREASAPKKKRRRKR